MLKRGDIGAKLMVPGHARITIPRSSSQYSLQEDQPVKNALRLKKHQLI